MAKRKGRPRKYTAAKFRQDVERYFASISALCVDDSVRTIAGEPLTRVLYLDPPTISGLCLYLGIDRSTWQNYADAKRNPEFAEVCAEVRMRIEAYLERELLTREKSVQGVIFNLSNNYGWAEKRATENRIEIGEETRTALENMTIAEKFAAIRAAAAEIEKLEES